MQQLREWLRDQNMTQKALAEAVGMQYNYVSQICRGEMPLSDGFRLRFLQQFGFDPATFSNGHSHQDAA